MSFILKESPRDEDVWHIHHEETSVLVGFVSRQENGQYSLETFYDHNGEESVKVHLGYYDSRKTSLKRFSEIYDSMIFNVYAIQEAATGPLPPL